MDAATLAWLDQEDAHIGTIIRRYGWFIQYVYGDPICTEPGCSCSDQDSVPFAYTVGLFGMNHPELLIFGVSQETAGGVLNELGDRIRAGRICCLDSWSLSNVGRTRSSPRMCRILARSCCRQIGSIRARLNSQFPCCS
jgi:hypothetical protein